MSESVANTPQDPTLEFTELKLGKKTYKLIYDFEAIARAEDLTGMDLLVGVNWAKVNTRRARAMLFASALKAQPNVTLDEFTPYVRPKYIREIEAALVKTWMSSEPEKDTGSAQEAEQNPPAPEPAAAN